MGNPPYNAHGKVGTGNTLWNKFVVKSLNEWITPGGYLTFVHPSGWRKPCYKKSQLKGLFKLMAISNWMMYLSMHDITDGKKVFSAGTRYDWYVIKKTKPDEDDITTVLDYKRTEWELYLPEWQWLPNYNLDIINGLLSGGRKGVDVMKDSSYHTISEYVSKSKSDKFCHPLIHATNKSGIRYMYSNTNTRGHFGISKIIFGDSGINKVVVDLDGKYGMTEHVIAIKVSEKKEVEELKSALLSDKFDDVIKSCSFSSFQIDWRLFTYFRKDFYKYL